MNPFGYWPVRVSGALILVGAFSACLLWAREKLLDTLDVSGEGQVVGREQRRAEDLEVVGRGMVRRLYAKDRLAQEVAAGRLSLLEAAARFQDLDRMPPTFNWVYFREHLPGLSDEERHCREVIDFVRGSPGDAAENQATVARLEKELQALRERGPIQLPRS